MHTAGVKGGRGYAELDSSSNATSYIGYVGATVPVDSCTQSGDGRSMCAIRLCSHTTIMCTW